MSNASHTPSLTPSRSPSPIPPVQPDHFYGCSDSDPPSPSSDGKSYLDPEDDLLASRGIPVFKPTMQEFADFEGYIEKIECWGSKSGIVKIIPPKEWTEALPPLQPQLSPVKIKKPIEQHMLGRSGLFRQENVEKRRIMSVREWAELCAKEELRAPGINDVGLHARAGVNVKKKTRRSRKAEEEVQIKEEDLEMEEAGVVVTPPVSGDSPLEASSELGQNGAGSHLGSRGSQSASPPPEDDLDSCNKEPSSTARNRKPPKERDAERALKDTAFNATFNPHVDWLPSGTKKEDYSPDFCTKLERQYWRNCGLGKPAWYGADTQGSLFTDATTEWNVAHLPSALSRLLPSSSKGLPGVNTPYLYFGMWRATFAWHVEDMDLFSINYIHFGAPKFWYACPQGRAGALEGTMKGYFPKDTSQCPQFLRHKSFLASPTLLAQSSCRPNHLVQHSGEFVVTFPRGYHAGFNLGLNCAESVNFALESWLEMGKKARVCECVGDSVRIDVDQLLKERDEKDTNPSEPKSRSKSSIVLNAKPCGPRKRKAEGDVSPKPKKPKIKTENMSKPLTVTLKLGPRPVDSEPFPCCLCVSRTEEGLLRVVDPPVGEKDDGGGGPGGVWMAHEICAGIVPETWVDEIEDPGAREGEKKSEKVVYGVDGIVKDRWNLKCSSCTKARQKAHGAPIQCTKGRCPKAFHVLCARDGGSSGIVFNVLKEVEKEVVLVDPSSTPIPASTTTTDGGDAMLVDTDGNPIIQDSLAGPRVLKIIKKVDAQVLCSQHNPAVAAAKKAAKQDKIKNDLLAMPSMTRIKMRVSAGVFEVSLLRVIEETGSVEVLWDRGQKREFKWGSVVFGSTEGQTVVQKPAEFGPGEQQQGAPRAPLTAFPSTSAAASSKTSAHTTTPPTTAPVLMQYPSYPPQNRYGTGAWSYHPLNHTQSEASPVPQPSYNNYYRNPHPSPLLPKPAPGSAIPHQSYVGGYPATPNQYRAQLQWQQPYIGPRPGTNYYRPHVTQPPQEGASGVTIMSLETSSRQTDGRYGVAAPRYSTYGDELSKSCTDLPDIRSAYQELSSLSALQPSQIEGIFKQNPDLRVAAQVAAARDGERTAGVS